jgi:hypothetical protein
VSRAGFSRIPTFGERRGGARSHPPPPRAGDAEGRQGRPFVVVVDVVVDGKKLLRVSSPLLEETPPSPSNELPDLCAPPARKKIGETAGPCPSLCATSAAFDFCLVLLLGRGSGGIQHDPPFLASPPFFKCLMKTEGLDGAMSLADGRCFAGALGLRDYTLEISRLGLLPPPRPIFYFVFFSCSCSRRRSGERRSARVPGVREQARSGARAGRGADPRGARSLWIAVHLSVGLSVAGGGGSCGKPASPRPASRRGLLDVVQGQWRARGLGGKRGFFFS